MTLRDEKQSTRPDLEEVLVGYYRAADRGVPPTPEELLAAHPHLVVELKEFFSGQELLAVMPANAESCRVKQVAVVESPPELGDLIAEDELGRGGIGVVYRVRDPQLGRELAVKVLRERYRDDADARQRFVEESQICAQLQHPGIVPIHARGTLADGRPYFTMKLVRGRTLATFLAQRTSPLDDFPQMLGVFEQVCQTVAYAHDRRVLHRDLKPGNIMVGAFGEVQVMDWGLAKVLSPRADDSELAAPDTQLPIQTVRTHNDDGQTVTGHAFGTPAYMPPEQAQGRVSELDERCDVFALGAILCEILTGEPPYDGSSREVLDQVRRGDVTEAFARLDLCAADPALIHLARRCLAPQRDERPRNAGEVVSALRTHQDGLREQLRRTELDFAATSAREAEAVLTVQAERRARHRTRALAVAVILLIAGVAGVLWLQEKQLNERVREQTVREAALATDCAAETREAQTFIAQGWQLRAAPERWAESLRSARVALERAQRLIDNADVTDEMRRSVAEVSAAFDEAERSQKLFAGIEATRNRMAESTGGRWNTEELSAGYLKVFKDYGLDVSDADPEEFARQVRQSPLHEHLLDALDEWFIMTKDLILRMNLNAIVMAADSAPKSIRKRIREVIVRSDFLALGEIVRSEEARKLSAAGTVNLVTMAYVMANLEAMQQITAKTGRPVDVRLLNSNDLPPHYPGRDECLALLRHAVARYPDDFWLNHNLALLLNAKNDVERPEAMRHATVSVALRPRSAAARYSFGIILLEAGDLNNAETALRKSIELDPDELRARIGLGSILMRRNDGDGALQEFGEAVKKAPASAQARFSLGCALMVKKKDDDGLAAFRKAVELEPSHAPSHTAIGKVLLVRQQRSEAISEFQLSLRLNPSDADTHLLLAGLLREALEVGAAMDAYQKAIELGAKLPRRSLAEAHHGLGLCLANLGERKRALTAVQTAAQLDPQNASIEAHRQRLAGETDAERKKAVVTLKEAVALYPTHERLALELAEAYWDVRETDQAVAAFRKCIELNTKNVVPRAKLGAMLLENKDVSGAITELRAAVEVDPKHVPGQIFLAKALYQKGDLPEALAVVKNGLTISPKHPQGLDMLARCLEATGDVPGAIDVYRQAIEADRNNAGLPFSLGLLLARKNDLRGAAIEFEKAAELEPKNSDALLALAGARAAMTDFDGSIAALRRISDLNTNARALRAISGLYMVKGDWKAAVEALQHFAKADSANAPLTYVQLAECQLALGDRAEAINAAREAIRLAPALPLAHYSLGSVYTRGQQPAEALDAYREAVKIAPRVAEYRFALGGALHTLGRFADAAREFGEAVEHCPFGDPRRPLYVKQKDYIQVLCKLEPELAARIKSKEEPTDCAEALALADLCRRGEKKHYAAAARFYAAAVAARPDIADEVITDHRHLAAASAVQAAAGNGSDAGALDEGERTRLRKQGLEWLKADLTVYSKTLETTPPQIRHRLRLGLDNLRTDRDLTPVRDKEMRSGLPAEERKAWEQFWTEVDGLIAKIDGQKERQE